MHASSGECLSCSRRAGLLGPREVELEDEVFIGPEQLDVHAAWALADLTQAPSYVVLSTQSSGREMQTPETTDMNMRVVLWI